jgi:hypothetical protein
MVENNWFAKGTYYEACNCEAICPCRKVDGIAKGRATYETCNYALSWEITEGCYNDVVLDGLRVVMVGIWHDGTGNEPWDIIACLDDRANENQHHALEQIFLGKAGGNILFARGVAQFRDVRSAHIELDHSTDNMWIKVGDVIKAHVDRMAEYKGDVTCGLPGHENIGQESISSLNVNVDEFQWDFVERCGFTAKFDYASNQN